MSRSTFTCMILVAMASVYLEARWSIIEGRWRAQVDLLPVFAAYAALHGGRRVMVGVALVSGTWLDLLSANPLGTSLLSLTLTSFILHGAHEMILKGQLAAQSFICFSAGALNTFMSVLFLWGSGMEPLIGWGTPWQIMVNALVCGLVGPFLFIILNQLDRWVSYEPMAKPWHRTVVEVKRNRHYH